MGWWSLGLWLLAVMGGSALADKMPDAVRITPEAKPGANRVVHRCLTPLGNDQKLGGLERTRPWSLPGQALAADFDTTIHCLVLRFNFQYEDEDDPNTTGRGRMDLRPIASLPDDQILDSLGHFVDPPPHDSAYFYQHLASLARYWEQVSEGKVHLTWDIYPPTRDSVYTLPEKMSAYGRCEPSEVVPGLIKYAQDCLKLADTVHRIDPGHPNIDFRRYGAFFLFHAGSDGQNDVGFPATCSDLYTGFVRFGSSYDDSLGQYVDDAPYVDKTDLDSVRIPNALMMPETAMQDNRITALNAVMAHEFGHQLGLPDIYSTATMFTQLGDFALMDNNGFGTSVDLGFPGGAVFGLMPVYPMAWSRAFLGFVDVEDLRADTSNVRLIAAELFENPGLKVARIPITETEYYLLENRIPDTDGKATRPRFDKTTSVVMGPFWADATDTIFTGEFDFLMPGDPTGGMLVLHVDEAVAALDYDGNGLDNFANNHLQWWVADQERKFIELVEADGIVHLGGNYHAGYGKADDLFRDDRNHALTPNSNPGTIDNSGNNTRIRITDIRRDTLTGVSTTVYQDSVILFDLEIDRRVPGFPVRAGQPMPELTPTLGLSPIADDLDGDGSPEIIAVAGKVLSVMTSTGEDFLRNISTCDTCSLYLDTAASSVNTGSDHNPAALYPVPVYVEAPEAITAGPATGKFNPAQPETHVVIGYSVDEAGGRVVTHRPADLNVDGRADGGGVSFPTIGWPIALSFGDRIWCLTDSGTVYRMDNLGNVPTKVFQLSDSTYFGTCRLGQRLAVLSGDEEATNVHVFGDTVHSFSLGNVFDLGPIAVDMNDDDLPELIAFSSDGRGVYLTVDTSGATPLFSVLAEVASGLEMTTSPSAGDIDDDGRPDVVVGGRGYLHAFNASLILKTDYPLEIDDRYPDSVTIAPPVVADIGGDDFAEVIIPGAVGNFYAFGPEPSYGFPLSSGEQRERLSGSSAVVLNDADGGKLGYLGGDGWFYAWEVDLDTASTFWPMAGSDPHGSFALSSDRFPTQPVAAAGFDETRYYNYPNPAREGVTRIRYYLGEEANSVLLKIYDLSGREVEQLEGTTTGGADNEVVWDCSSITSGVYRCVIEVDSPNESTTAHTDIAVVR